MKKTIKLTENDLNKLIAATVKNAINEMRNSEKQLDSNGAYDYPEGIDDIIVSCENDRDCMESYESIARAVYNLHKRGVELDLQKLTNSGTMKKLQQQWFRAYRELTHGEGRNFNPDPYKLRLFLSNRIIDDIMSGSDDAKFD